ncbi:hypothetical protein I4U23_027618 [Adineta vaga]|nr:hypothetical protein I4U23_027618 [Adineta vaga]
MIYGYIVLGLLFNFVKVLESTHFLGGSITWRVLNTSAIGTPVAIVITQTYSWTWSYAKCNSTQIANSEPLPIVLTYNGVSNTLDCIINCGSGSVGYSAPPILPDCTDVSPIQGTTVGQRSDIVYLQQNDDFTVAFQDTGWRPLAFNSSGDWSLASRIAVIQRPDNGLYNSAPVATVMSPINIPCNQSTVITVPLGDPDGDTMRCRWASGYSECGGVCPPSSLPPNTIIFSNCTIVITGENINDWFAVALMVEDFINSSSTTPLSSVPVQFLVRVVSPPSCTIRPDIIGLPAEQSCTVVKVGDSFISQLIAINHCGPSVRIIEIATLSFSGMVQSDIINQSSTTYYKNITWIPTAAQLGYQVMCAMALNSQNFQSAQYCFTFYVSENGADDCPSDVLLTTSTTTSTTTSLTNDTTHTIITSITSEITSDTSFTTNNSSATSTTLTKTTSIPHKVDFINWPLFGSLIGLALLGTTVLCCCLCWNFCRSPNRRRKHKRDRTLDNYCFERRTDSDNQWSYTPTNLLSDSLKNYFFDNISNERTNNSADSQRTSLTEITNGPSDLKENSKDLGSMGFHRTSFLSTNNKTSISKETVNTGIHTTTSADIKSLYRKSKENKLLSASKRKSIENVTVTRVKLSTKQRSLSNNAKAESEQHLTTRVNKQTCSSRANTEATNVVRIIRVPSHPSTKCRSSIAENTIRLDDIDKIQQTLSTLKTAKDLSLADTRSQETMIDNTTKTLPTGIHIDRMRTFKIKRF